MAPAGRLRRPPTRSCVACRTPREKRELLRVVRDPAGAVAIDPTGRANGRGAYVCRSGGCLTDAIRRGALSRALGVPVAAELLHELEAVAATIATTEGGSHGQE